jgi:hypothetical protein
MALHETFLSSKWYAIKTESEAIIENCPVKVSTAKKVIIKTQIITKYQRFDSIS